MIWVDDILYFGDKQSVSNFKLKFSESFKVDDRGVMKWLLGMQVVQNVGIIFVNQKSYRAEVLKRFNMSDCNAVSTPGDSNFFLTKSSCPVPDSPESVEMSEIHPQYRSLVGNLLYVCCKSSEYQFYCQ